MVKRQWAFLKGLCLCLCSAPSPTWLVELSREPWRCSQQPGSTKSRVFVMAENRRNQGQQDWRPGLEAPGMVAWVWGSFGTVMGLPGRAEGSWQWEAAVNAGHLGTEEGVTSEQPEWGAVIPGVSLKRPPPAPGMGCQGQGASGSDVLPPLCPSPHLNILWNRPVQWRLSWGGDKIQGRAPSFPTASFQSWADLGWGREAGLRVSPVQSSDQSVKRSNSKPWNCVWVRVPLILWVSRTIKGPVKFHAVSGKGSPTYKLGLFFFCLQSPFKLSF